MPWTVRIQKSAERELDELPEPVWQEAIATIAEFEEDPFPVGSIPLRGHANLYRVRFSNQAYRIVYLVSKSQHKVLIVRVRHRGTVYDGL